jgi:hypothetical protein
MKFLIDAQLPRRLAAQFRQARLEAIHTLDLPDGNRTTDRVINELSIKEQYIVVTEEISLNRFSCSESRGNFCSFQPATLGTTTWKVCFNPAWRESLRTSRL